MAKPFTIRVSAHLFQCGLTSLNGQKSRPKRLRRSRTFALRSEQGASNKAVMTVPKHPLNVVYIISDQHRRDFSGCYGHPLVKTPNLDRLASQSVRFGQAYTPSPLCITTRTVLLTGRELHRCGAPGIPGQKECIPPQTLASLYRQAGYATAAFGKVHVPGETDANDIGFDERALRIYTPMSNDYQHAIGLDNFWKYCSYLPGYVPPGNPPGRHTYNPTNQAIDLPDDLIMDSMVADRSLDFLRRNRANPFFLWVGFEKPHPELYAPQRFHDMYNPADMPLPEDMWDSRETLPDTVYDNPTFPIFRQGDFTDDQLRNCMAAYCANVTYLDEQIGRVLDGIEEMGLADNTIVVYTTDHGENLFKRAMIHKMCFFEEAVGVPLMVRTPGMTRPGAACDHLVGTLDLFPTLLESCGLEIPEGTDGKSLRLAMEADEPIHDAVFSELYVYGTAQRMMRTSHWKYIHSHNDLHEMYDLQADPFERRNLVLEVAYAQTAAKLDAQLCKDWRMPDLTNAPRKRGDTRQGQRGHTQQSVRNPGPR